MYTRKFQRCAKLTFSWEGFFSNDPKDKGGATKFGISQSFYELVKGRSVSVSEMKAITKAEARNLYYDHFWIPARCEDLPLGLDLIVFDWAINSSVETAVKQLQLTLGV